MLRDRVRGTCSFTKFLNEGAGAGGRVAAAAKPINAAWHVRRPAGRPSALMLEWVLLADVAAGEELLTAYNDRVDTRSVAGERYSQKGGGGGAWHAFAAAQEPTTRGDRGARPAPPPAVARAEKRTSAEEADTAVASE